MISFSQLGRHGRLGNQMFQYALLLGVAARRGFQIRIPLKHADLDTFQLRRCRSLRLQDTVAPHCFKEQQFHYDPRVFELEDDTDYYGYFQSQRYFQHCQAAVREEFTFQAGAASFAADVIEEWQQDHDYLVSLNVRRGDYVQKQDYHTLLPASWYHAAMEHFPGATFVVCSDDISWCRRNLQGNLLFDPAVAPRCTLALMSRCAHHILSASSFSWWGAWLNPSPTKRVLAPDPWFGPLYRAHDTSDLLPTGWETLEVKPCSVS